MLSFYFFIFYFGFRILKHAKIQNLGLNESWTQYFSLFLVVPNLWATYFCLLSKPLECIYNILTSSSSHTSSSSSNPTTNFFAAYTLPHNLPRCTIKSTSLSKMVKRLATPARQHGSLEPIFSSSLSLSLLSWTVNSISMNSNLNRLTSLELPLLIPFIVGDVSLMRFLELLVQSMVKIGDFIVSATMTFILNPNASSCNVCLCWKCEFWMILFYTWEFGLFNCWV